MRRGAKPAKENRGSRVHDLEKRLAEARQREATALDQQTATSEILRVISQSPTDTQPVFDTIVRSAATLCHADVAAVFLTDGQMVSVPANYGSSPEALGAVRARFPRPLDMESSGGIAILTRSVVHVPDIEEPSVGELLRQNGRRVGFRSLITVPMLRAGAVVGAIGVYRREPGRFSDAEVALLQTFADQAVIAIENVRLFNETKEALERQTATGEILRVIASSPTDLGPVFETILSNARQLCDGFYSLLFLCDGEQLNVAATHNVPTEGLEALKHRYPIPITSDEAGLTARAVRERRLQHVADIQTETNIPEASRRASKAVGQRAGVAVPLLREGQPVGALTVSRQEARPFSERELALLQTFADQAVIAIENVRLFTELQDKNQALTQAHAQVSEALEQQTATSEILRVISSSPTDLTPVLDAVARNAARLCEVDDLAILRAEGDGWTIMFSLGPDDAFRGRHLPKARTAMGRAMGQHRTVHIPDLLAEPDLEVRPEFQAFGWRTGLVVPLLREGIAFGAISARRKEVRPFTDAQIALLETFAAQAVIAIENVRLFTETKEALEQQTATAEILEVISRSPGDLQPVLDAVAENSARLCEATDAQIYRLDGDVLRLVASFGALPGALPGRPVSRGSVTGRSVVDRRTVHVQDLAAESDAEFPIGRETQRRVGHRTTLATPLLREGQPLGAILIRRMEVRPFSDKQIKLLETFADQAVIAVENARLLTELRARTQELTRSVEQLTALGEVGRAVSSTLDLETVLATIVARAVQLSALDGGVVFEYDEDREEFVQRVATEVAPALAEARRTTRIRKGEGVLGQTAITLEPVQVPDITARGAYTGRLRETLIQSGVRAILAVPMVREAHLIGCLVVTRNRAGDFPAETIELLRTFATQSALAIQNARLFREIEDKSRQLEAASRHKSEFLANMSHELRTPLNAIIGFSEVLAARMFGEVNAKQAEYLQDILESGQHLLSLINDILDLSKVEAGRMELEAADFDLPSAIENALILVRERASRRGITLASTVEEPLGLIRGDERKVKQVLLNLLSNALKFTPEGGRVEVRAALRDGRAEVSVADTGVGIAPEDQEAVFEEFRQVGTADKKVEGTGLGLALSRKFVELHGGRIWVESELGRGATFTFTLPVS